MGEAAATRATTEGAAAAARARATEWGVELAPSGRAHCRACGKAIAKGAIRWAEEDRRGKRGPLVAHFHLDCLKYPNRTDARFALDDVKGLSELSGPTQRRVHKAFNTAVAASVPQRPPRPPAFRTFHRRFTGSSSSSAGASGGSATSAASSASEASVSYSADTSSVASAGQTTTQSALEQAWQKLTVDQLKNWLRINKQLLKGRKADLVERCLDGVWHGRLLHCPACGLGQLALAEKDKSRVECHGYWDPEVEMRETCDFAAAANDPRVKRGRWLRPGKDDPAEAEQDAAQVTGTSRPGQTGRAASKENKAANSNARGRTDAASRKDGHAQPSKDDVQEVVKDAEADCIAMPRKRSAAEQAAADALTATGGSRPEAVKRLRTERGRQNAPADAEFVQPEDVAHSRKPENDKIADTLDKLGHLESEAKEGDSFHWRARAYHRAAAAVRDAKGPITSGKQARDLPGVGRGVASRIDELKDSGHVHRIAELRREAARK